MLTALALSLALTLLAEVPVGALWGLRRRDLLLCVLVNVLTNPAVVLLHSLFPGWGVTLALEGAAVLAEGAYYARYGRYIPHPWRLSLVSNVLSFGGGLMLAGLL